MLKVHHLGLWVRELDRSSQFYQHILGFEKQYAYQLPVEIVHQVFGRDISCQVAVYRRDEVILELFQPGGGMTDEAQGPLSPGINHLSLRVEDKQAFCLEARRKGAHLIEVDRKDHLVLFIRDPDGILIEIKDK